MRQTTGRIAATGLNHTAIKPVELTLQIEDGPQAMVGRVVTANLDPEGALAAALSLATFALQADFEARDRISFATQYGWSDADLYRKRVKDALIEGFAEANRLAEQSVSMARHNREALAASDARTAATIAELDRQARS